MAWTSGECGKRPFDDGGSSGGFAVRFSKCGTNVRLGQKVSTEKNRDLGLCRDTSALQVISEAKACPIRIFVPHFEVPAEFRGTRSPFGSVPKVGVSIRFWRAGEACPRKTDIV